MTAPDAVTGLAVAVLGAGVMGAGIAQVLAQHGHDVVCRDPDPAALDRAASRLHDGRYGLVRAVERGYLRRDEAGATASRLRFTDDLAAIGTADVVIECVPEDPELKLAVLSEAAGRVRPDTVIATNSSGLPLETLRPAVSNDERFLAWHWASPAVTSPFAEIVVHDGTADAVVEQVSRLADSLGRHPVVVRDDPEAWGYVANRVYAAVLREASTIVDRGLCDAEGVDRLLTDCFGWPNGPFGMVRGAATGRE